MKYLKFVKHFYVYDLSINEYLYCMQLLYLGYKIEAILMQEVMRHSGNFHKNQNAFWDCPCGMSTYVELMGKNNYSTMTCLQEKHQIISTDRLKKLQHLV